ncbi:MAG: hypothetical protein QXO47_07050 [Thermoproteota archaeon]
MSSLKTRLEGIALIILALTTCFTPSLLLSRVIAQGGDYEAFLSRLEEYLWDAMPSESDPVRECEYIVPDGFDASQAERLWRVFASNVSTGCSEQDFRRELGRIYPNGTITLDVNGSLATLNLTGLRIEKPEDGSVRVKIPLESSVPLNYTYFNSTSVKVMYEAWNETLVSLYEVERYTGLYRYVIKNVEKNVVFDIVSRLTVGLFPKEMGVGRIMVAYPAKDWPWFLGNPIIAVPGHYEDVRIRVPEHEENLKVLFPGYDPVFAEGWIVTASVSSTSLTLGETLEVHYEAGYGGVVQPEPLNASLKITVTEGFEPLDSVERILNDTHTSGVFRLRAVKPGLHNITLFLTGNAYLSTWPPSGNASFSILIVGPASPSVNIQVLNVDPSIMKHAGLTLELSNTGGSAARSVSIHVTGVHAEPAGVSVGDIDVGGSRRVELNIRLTRSSTEITVRASYRDDEGNNYFSEAKTWVWTRSIWVPEHFEEIKVVVPEHEETVRVFVPDSKHFTHVRFYELTFSYPGSGLVASMPTFQGHYGGFELVSRLKPTGEKEVNGSSVETVAKVDFILLSIEPYWENLGVYEEKEAAGLLEVDPAALRVNGSLEGHRARLVKQFWRTSGRIVMNATRFAVYNHTVSNYVVENRLQNEFILRWRKITNATRLSQPSGEKGFLTLIYRPLTVRGSGPLQSIQVRNYAGFNASYVLRVQQFRHQAYQNYPPVMDVYSSPLLVKSWDYNVTLAGLNTREGYTCLVSLMYGLNLVAQAVFSLNPEPSPFWTGFWDGIKGKLTGILVTSTIIIVTAVLTGGGTVAGCVGAGLSIAATLSHLIGGSIVNIQEFNQGWNTVMLLSSLADFYGNLSYRLSNYTPPKMEPTMPYVPPPIVEDFQPKGPLAELFWETSKEYRRAASKVLADTGLNIVLDVGISDFETALNPEAKEYDKGLACGRIVGTVLSVLGFMAATRIAAELRPKMEGFRANMWSAVGSLKAWLTFALYDLVETLVKGGRTIAWIVKNHGVTLGFARLTVLGTLEKLKGRELEIWRRIRGEVKNAVEEAESKTSEEDCRRVLEEKALEKMEAGGGLGGKLTEAAGRIDQEKAVELFYRLDEAGLSLEERTRILDELNTIAGKSREAGDGVVEWLKRLEAGRLKEALDILLGVSRLEESVLKDVGEAWRLNSNVDDFNGLLKGLSFTPDYPAQGKGFYELLHECVESRSLERLRFLERGYGWIAEVRTMELEPGQKPAKIVENSFPFVRDVLNTLDGDCLRKISNILDNLLEFRGKKGAYDAMLDLKRHLFVDIGLGEEEPKIWLVEECLEKWEEASRLSYAVVSHQTLDARGHYRARSPVKVNYLDASNNEVIPIISDEDTKGGFGITIPEDTVEYLGLKDEGFIIFYQKLGDAGLIVPIKAESDGRIAVSECLERLLRAVLSERGFFQYLDESGKLKWSALEEDRIILKFNAHEEDGGKTVSRMMLLRDPQGKSVRIRLSSGFEKRMVVLSDFALKSLGELGTEDALSYFKELGLTGEVLNQAIEAYWKTLPFTEEDADYAFKAGLLDINLKGRLGERIVTEWIAEKDPTDIEGIRRKYGEGKKEIDIMRKKSLVQVRFWDEETVRLHLQSGEIFSNDVKDLIDYKKVMVESGKEKVELVFVEEISQELFNEFVNKLVGTLGEDTLSWLKPVNGYENLEVTGP